MTLRHVLFAIGWLAFGVLAWVGVAQREKPAPVHIHVVKTKLTFPHREFVHAGELR